MRKHQKKKLSIAAEKHISKDSKKEKRRSKSKRGKGSSQMVDLEAQVS